MHRTTLASIACVLLVTAIPAQRAAAWHEIEHGGIVAAAAIVLDREPRRVKHPIPRFFIDGLPGDAAQCSVDPDIFKLRKLEQLDHAEFPEHFFDLEYLDGEALPPLRYDYYHWCYRRGLDPRHIGTLPYAVTEWAQKLTMAFAEHRARPRDNAIQRKCLVYAGLLAHYAADLAQPLHTTVHYDGRVDQVGDPSPKTGIHMKADALLRKLDGDFVDLTRDLEPASFGNLFDAVVAELRASHRQVERLYELQDAIDAAGETITDEALEAFAVDRLRAAVRFTASLYRTAWAKSHGVSPPDWLDRDTLTDKAQRKS